MTDGIIEAEDTQGTPYSASGRLEQRVAGFTEDSPAAEMVEAVINDAIVYSEGKAHEKDDMTVVVVKFNDSFLHEESQHQFLFEKFAKKSDFRVQENGVTSGDVNLRNVTDPNQPFALVQESLPLTFLFQFFAVV